MLGVDACRTPSREAVHRFSPRNSMLRHGLEMPMWYTCCEPVILALTSKSTKQVERNAGGSPRKSSVDRGMQVAVGGMPSYVPLCVE